MSWLKDIFHYCFGSCSSCINDRQDKRDIQKVVDTYEKGVLLENKTVHVNARIGKEELVQELKKRGFRFVTKRIDKVEELWNLSDGIILLVKKSCRI